MRIYRIFLNCKKYTLPERAIEAIGVVIAVECQIMSNTYTLAKHFF